MASGTLRPPATFSVLASWQMASHTHLHGNSDVPPQHGHRGCLVRCWGLADGRCAPGRMQQRGITARRPAGHGHRQGAGHRFGALPLSMNSR
jgi:hypothetical protein